MGFTAKSQMIQYVLIHQLNVGIPKFYSPIRVSVQKKKIDVISFKVFRQCSW